MKGGITKMSKVKTAISIQEELLGRMDYIARKEHVPRSNLFERAAEDFLERQRNKDVLSRLNEVYRKTPTAEEKKLQKAMNLYNRKIAEGEW